MPQAQNNRVSQQRMEIYKTMRKVSLSSFKVDFLRYFAITT
jgi:hypothetical protein